ncbi:MAG: hypothetical protein ACI87E_000001 [Mariniblastus sp.]
MQQGTFAESIILHGVKQCQLAARCDALTAALRSLSITFNPSTLSKSHKKTAQGQPMWLMHSPPGNTQDSGLCNDIV